MVVGPHKSGKTRTIELLASMLRGKLRLATMKHVHEFDYTFDLKGKDTWRHREAGAEATLALTGSEMVFFQRVNSKKLSWGRLVRLLEGYDLVLAEGFRFKAARRRDAWKIVTARTFEEACEFGRQVSPILAVASWNKPLRPISPKTPVFKLPEEGESLLRLILRRVLRWREEKVKRILAGGGGVT